MNQILHKTLLDTLLALPQQNPFAKSFAFDWARSTGSILNAKKDFGDGNEFIGTNQDDRATIGRNLTGGLEDPTRIDLLDGNDILTVKGNIVVDEDYLLSIRGGAGTNTVNVNGDVINHSSDNRDALSLNLGIDEIHLPENASNDNVLNISGSIYLDNYSTTEIELNGTESRIDIAKNILASDHSRFNLYANSNISSLSVHGDVYAQSGAKVELSFYGEATSINFEGTLNADDGAFFTIGSIANYSNLNLKDINIDHDSFVSFDSEYGNSGQYGSTGDFTIDGDITVLNNSTLSFFLEPIFNFEVIGSMVVQNSFVSFNDYGSNFSFLGGISNEGGYIDFMLMGRNEQTFYIEGDLVTKHTNPSVNSGRFDFVETRIEMGNGENTFALVGNLIAEDNSSNTILTAEGNDTISITGNVSVSDGGQNTISTYVGDDVISLNGRIGAGALVIDAGDGNDTLVLTAATQRLFETDYKEWLTDLSASGSLAKSGLETIRIDVNFVQQNKLGWLTDIVNKANADGAHIAVEDKAGHQLINPSAYLAQSNDTHNPINDVLDHYAPAAAAAQPKAFAENATAPSGDAFTAPHFDDNSFLHEMEQQAQVHAAVAA